MAQSAGSTSSEASPRAPPGPGHADAGRSLQDLRRLVPSDDEADEAAGGGPSQGGGGPDPKKRPAGEKAPDYYANVGDAIRTLRDDLPFMFVREPDFSIYREDIVFKDPRNSFAGLERYKTIFWSLRFHAKIFFSIAFLEVKRIWQPADGEIAMRWVVRGVPRVPWEAEGTFEGVSKYKLDSNGAIYEHSVDNIILRDPPVAFGIPQFVNPLIPKATQPVGTPCPFFEDFCGELAPSSAGGVALPLGAAPGPAGALSLAERVGRVAALMRAGGAFEAGGDIVDWASFVPPARAPADDEGDARRWEAAWRRHVRCGRETCGST